MIPDVFLSELLSRIDIVDVVNRHVPLKKRGAQYVALCPFHSEKTPSFQVIPDKQFYHCFGCGAHDTAIGFLMNHLHIDFIEAVEQLAEIAGMTMPGTETHQQHRMIRAPLTEVLGKAAAYYAKTLRTSPQAIEYLKSRGLTGRTVQDYGIGVAPDQWDGLKSVFSNYDDPSLLESGLVMEKNDHRFDFFRNRIMFPVLGPRGDVIAFGGRTLDDDPRKYVNSPQTTLFDKGRELYGLSQARHAIREQDFVIVVEGYMDVLMMAQFGWKNTVAAMGVSCTPAHANTLLRHATRVVFCFDGDDSGRKAALRAMETCLPLIEDGKLVQFLFLPDGEDPDTYLLKYGADAFKKMLNRPVNLSEMLLRHLKEGADTESAEGRAALVTQAKPFIIGMRQEARALYAQIRKQIASLTSMSEGELEERWGISRLPSSPASVVQRLQRALPPATLEAVVLRSILTAPESIAYIATEDVTEDTPEGRALKDILVAMAASPLQGTGPGFVMEMMRGTPHEPLIADILTSSVTDPVPAQTHHRMAKTAGMRLRERRIIRDVQSAIARASAQELQGLLKQKSDVQRLIAETERENESC
jgi:DNA primase